ncbi:RHS repeat domain-containing protein [Enterobacter mori]
MAVTGSAGSPVRALTFLRHPDEAGAGTPARVLVSRTVADIPARTGYLYGARPLRAAPDTVVPDAVTVSSLTGQTLRLHTADGDASLALTDTAGRSLWARSAQGTVSTFTYEAPETAGRPLSVTETATTEGGGTVSRVRETFTYGPADGTHRARNLAGALTVHRHNAGCSRLLALSLTGQPLSTEEQLLAPEAALPDWPGSEAALEVSRLTTRGTYDATGAPLTQTNAAGVTTVTAYDVSGAVRESRLRYAGTAGEPEQDVVTLTDILYRADGVVLSQTAGNGITQTYEYDPKTQRLRRHTVQRPAGHPQGAQVISDLHYAYDPAGNILTLNEMATDAQWHRNRMTDGMRTYAYDTLYRLVSATGRERLPDTARGPQTRLAGTLQSDIVITDAGGVRLIQDRLSGETRLRYAFTDHLNSTSGETDEAGNITAREEYYPYGGSAGSDEEAEEIHDRTARYSGKERDATGLYYYGWRYYQPEAGRWLSADPGGLIDGVNLFRFCHDNPVIRIDQDGQNDEVNDLLRMNFQKNVKVRIEIRLQQDHAAAMARLKNAYGLKGQELGETLVKIVSYLNDAPRSVNVRYASLVNFTGNYLKNTFATGSRTDNSDYMYLRIERNRKLINFSEASEALKIHYEPYNLGLYGKINPVSSFAHPVHGSIQMQSLKPERGGAFWEEYGESAFFINSESANMAYLTYTHKDSMFIYLEHKRKKNSVELKDALATRNNMYPLIRYAEPEQMSYIYDVAVTEKEKKIPLKPYVEWQAHTRLNFGEDVNLLSVSESEKPKGVLSNLNGTNKTIKNLMKKNNISIIYQG